MNRIQNEYARLIDRQFCVSLLESFTSEDFHVEAFCRDYHPHPQMEEMVRSGIGFGRAAGILLPNADHYLTCALYLFPDAPPEMILLIVRIYAVDFYLNDTMGREYRSGSEERQRLNEIRERLMQRDEPATAAERANGEVLAELARTAPAYWFEAFLSLYLQHLSVAHRSYDCISLGYIPKIEEYIGIRADISGMPHTISLLEYSRGNYLDWPALETMGLAGRLRELGVTVSLTGALMNDLFSFEKEVIDNRSDSNLVAIIVLNNFRMELREALSVATRIVCNLLVEYGRLVALIDEQIRQLPEEGLRNEVLQWSEGVRKCVQACWLWQVETKRYKRQASIWKETSLSRAVPV